MATRIQLRRDTAADWVSNNPILELGEPGHETDTNKLKIGNGVDDWNSLDYAIIEQFDSQWNSLQATPTTLAGYGITDALPKTAGTITGALDAPTVDAHKLKFLYADQSAFPDATTYHGAIAHSHADGRMYFAHSGSWQALKNEKIYENIVLIDTPGSAYNYNFDNYSTGIFYHINLSANWTANFINLDVANNREFSFKFYIEQGPIPYVPVTLQLDSISQTITWQDGSAPTGTPNATDIITFSIVRYNNSWEVQAVFQKPAEGYTTLSEYGITDAYTQTQVNNLINGLNIGNIAGTSIVSPSNNQILTYSGGVWTNVSTYSGNVSTTSITSPLSVPITVTPETVFSTDVTAEGNLTVEGNLTIQGTTTTIESTTLVVQDKNITLASTAQNAAGSDGAGITVNGSLAEIKYVSSTDSWDLNKDLKIVTGKKLIVPNIESPTAGTGSVGTADSRIAEAHFDSLNLGTTKFTDAHFAQLPKPLYSSSDNAFAALAAGAFPTGATNFNTLLQATDPNTGFRYADVNQDGSVSVADYSDLFDYGEYLRTSGSSGTTTAQAAWEAIAAKMLEEPSLYANEYILDGGHKKIPVLESGASIGLGSDEIYIGDETNTTTIISDVEFRQGATLKNAAFMLNSEVLNEKTGASGTVAYDLSTGLVFTNSNSISNWTANFTNVPNIANRVISVSIIIFQNATPYLPTGVQVNGANATINWNGGVTPTGTSNGYDFINFTLVKTGGAYTVFGDGSSYS